MFYSLGLADPNTACHFEREREILYNLHGEYAWRKRFFTSFRMTRDKNRCNLNLVSLPNQCNHLIKSVKSQINGISTATRHKRIQ
jgi:hypothetical protein